MIPGSRGGFKRDDLISCAHDPVRFTGGPLSVRSTNGPFADTSVLVGVPLAGPSGNPPSTAGQSSIPMTNGPFSDASVLVGVPLDGHSETRQIISPRIIHSMFTMLVYIYPHGKPFM